jgi:hypothetical protein
MNKLTELESKLEKLRQDYKLAKLEDKKLIEIRAKILKKVINNYKEKHGFI